MIHKTAHIEHKPRTRFNYKTAISSELGTPQERLDKIAEMEERGYYAARQWEREVTHTGYEATGYSAAKFRYNGETARMKYGVLFRPVGYEESNSKPNG